MLKKINGLDFVKQELKKNEHYNINNIDAYSSKDENIINHIIKNIQMQICICKYLKLAKTYNSFELASSDYCFTNNNFNNPTEQIIYLSSIFANINVYKSNTSAPIYAQVANIKYKDTSRIINLINNKFNKLVLYYFYPFNSNINKYPYQTYEYTYNKKIKEELFKDPFFQSMMDIKTDVEGFSQNIKLHILNKTIINNAEDLLLKFLFKQYGLIIIQEIDNGLILTGNLKHMEKNKIDFII